MQLSRILREFREILEKCRRSVKFSSILSILSILRNLAEHEGLASADLESFLFRVVSVEMERFMFLLIWNRIFSGCTAGGYRGTAAGESRTGGAFLQVGRAGGRTPAGHAAGPPAAWDEGSTLEVGEGAKTRLTLKRS